MRTYIGEVWAGGGVVTVHEGTDQRLLVMRRDLGGHEAQGFSWGSAGPGAHLLAVSLLADVTHWPSLAGWLAWPALGEMLSTLPPQEDFVLTEDLIREQVMKHLDDVAEVMNQTGLPSGALLACPRPGRGCNGAN